MSVQYYRPGDDVAPEHKLERYLGRGSLGEVWKAVGPGGVELAVKIINLSGGQGLREFRAVRHLQRLRHPNLVPLFGFWLKDDRGYLMPEGNDGVTRIAGAAAEMVIAMGLGEKSLFDRLKECKRAGIKGVPMVELLDYIEDAARAIDYLNEPAHDLGQGPVGIQHCDIKPANILIVGNAGQVCDFGLARVLGDQGRASTAGALTPAYVAPEMIENKSCRPADQPGRALHRRADPAQPGAGARLQAGAQDRPGRLRRGLGGHRAGWHPLRLQDHQQPRWLAERSGVPRPGTDEGPGTRPSDGA